MFKKVSVVVLMWAVVAVLLTGCQGIFPNPGESPLDPGGGGTVVDIMDMLYKAGAHIIVGLIALDVVFGVAVALQQNAFDWAEFFKFYKTMVLPYILGYAGVYAVSLLIPDLLGAFLDSALVVTAFGAATGNLVRSILKNLSELKLQSPA